jgi:hypothetical protein
LRLLQQRWTAIICGVRMSNSALALPIPSSRKGIPRLRHILPTRSPSPMSPSVTAFCPLQLIPCDRPPNSIRMSAVSSLDSSTTATLISSPERSLRRRPAAPPRRKRFPRQSNFRIDRCCPQLDQPLLQIQYRLAAGEYSASSQRSDRSSGLSAFPSDAAAAFTLEASAAAASASASTSPSASASAFASTSASNLQSTFALTFAFDIANECNLFGHHQPVCRDQLLC